MARKNDPLNQLLGLLILVAIIGTIIAFAITSIFEFIADNMMGVSIFVGVAAVIFGLVKYTESQSDKKQREREIQNNILKKLKEEQDQRSKNIKREYDQRSKNIKREYDEKLNKISESQKKIIFKLKSIDSNLDKLEVKPSSVIGSYDPVSAMSNLKSILKTESISNDETWDIFYNKSSFGLVNPKAEFDQKIKEVDIVKDPKYFEFIEIDINEEGSELGIEIEQNKAKFNDDIKHLYNVSTSEIEARITSLTEKYGNRGRQWSKEFEKFEHKKNQKNSEIDDIKTRYYEKEKNAVISYHSKILEEIIYDPNFRKSVNVDFNDETGVLIIEYLLPSIEHFPNIKEMRYIKTRSEYKEIKYSERDLNKLYNDIIYRVVLDLICISFKSDLIDSIKSIVFNGWSNAINKATGLHNKACILSVVCDKTEFLKINLSEVDPKECFKGLKGISANKISNLTPVQPIISIERNDRRFVASQNIEVNSATNLAAMHWEDFEHLIREIFEKEFSINGGEVKVTQSSRDGGVDAIAFDPDPIRGGKIVIQAKRYTNLVGVSSVRDLYGTVMNEGATKGILVTTSDYGSDSFMFAKDKPLTLINGGNLLYLLEKHGYNARIDIKEAKELLK